MHTSRVSRSAFALLFLTLLCVSCLPVKTLSQSQNRLSQTGQSGSGMGDAPSQEKLPAEIEQLIERANSFFLQGNYAEAIPLAEKVLGLVRGKHATWDPESIELIMLKYLGDLYRLKGDYERSEASFKESILLAGRLVEPNDPFNAILQTNFGLLYLDKGEFARAAQVFDTAFELCARTVGAENPDCATILNNKGMAVYSLGDYAQAETAYKRSLAILEKTDNPNLANVLNNLGLLYQEMGEYGRGEESLRRALNVVEKIYGNEHPLYAKTLNNLATLNLKRGDFVQSEQLLQRALAIQEKKLGPTHPDVSLSLNNLAVAYKAMGNYARSEAMYQRSLGIDEKTYGTGHPSYAISLSNMAALYAEHYDYARAITLLRRALTIQEKSLGADHPKVAYTLSGLALLYVYTGDSALAEPMFQRALRIYEKSFTPEHPFVAEALNNYSRMFMNRGDYASAGQMQKRAAEIYEKTFGPQHPMLADLLSTLSWTYEAQGNMAQALSLQKRAADIQERNMSVILGSGSEEQKRLYMETYASSTSNVISMHVRSALASREAARLALTNILRRKGRALDAMTDQIGALRRRLNPQDLALLKELSGVNTRLAALTMKGAAAGTDAAQHRAGVASLEAEKERLETLVSARSLEFAIELQMVTLERVQKSIPAGMALVEIALYRPVNIKAVMDDERTGKPRYVAYVLRREGDPVFVDLGDAALIDRAITRFRLALADPANIEVKQIARALDELVMRPVRKLLGETRTILLSPDGELNLVPFAALVDERGRYLLEDYTFTYLTSGRDLLRLEAPSVQRQQPVVVANPTFDIAGATVNQNAPEKARGRRSLDFNMLTLSPLPGTAQEASAIKRIVPSALVLTERAATESALKSVAGPWLLHIATHGFFLKDQPPRTVNAARQLVLREAPREAQRENPLLRSGLLLAGVMKGQSGEGEDGVLTALEVAGLDLWGTRLVVLSACETGIGDVANGDGVYGLRRALVLAGAESQMMSLWQVSDAATKDLMVEYYRRIEGGEGRTDALRATQLGMLMGKSQVKQTAGRELSVRATDGGKILDYSHPYFWAGFIPIGDWRSLDRTTPALTEAPQRLQPISEPSGDADVRVHPGDTSFKQTPADYDRAIAEYRRALDVDPKNESAWQGIATAALRKGNSLMALDAINQLTSLNSSNPALRGLRAELEALRTSTTPKRN